MLTYQLWSLALAGCLQIVYSTKNRGGAEAARIFLQQTVQDDPCNALQNVRTNLEQARIPADANCQTALNHFLELDPDEKRGCENARAPAVCLDGTLPDPLQPKCHFTCDVTVQRALDESIPLGQPFPMVTVVEPTAVPIREAIRFLRRSTNAESGEGSGRRGPRYPKDHSGSQKGKGWMKALGLSAGRMGRPATSSRRYY